MTERLFITNRHVVDGATELQLNTWDGESLTAPVVLVAASNDLAIVQISGSFPETVEFASDDPKVGTEVVAVGFPLGGELTFSPGEVIEYVEDDYFGQAGLVMRLSTRIDHGNSGGAVFDEEGEVVGIIYAFETDTDVALAIPVSAFQSAMQVEDNFFVPSDDCAVG